MEEIAALRKAERGRGKKFPGWSWRGSLAFAMPYITHIHIENCRNIKLLDVNLSPEFSDEDVEETPKSANREKLPFRHLILTGPNGSGKSGVLELLASLVTNGLRLPERMFPPIHASIELRIERQRSHDDTTDVLQRFRFDFNSGDMCFAYVSAKRDFRQEKVPGPSELKLDITSVAPSKSLGNLLLQYLVNKHTERAYAIADGDHATDERIERWFKQLWTNVAKLMEDDKLNVSYDRQSFTFRFRKSEGYEFDLNTLADGHAAAFALIAEILLRIEAAQRIKKDFTFEPEGIVIVDEIETHLHLSLQEQILPLLTTMFPKVQFIVATHSPAVIASIPDAVVYDLRKGEQFISTDYRGIQRACVA